MTAMARFLWICLGGAAGTGARYLLSGWVLRAVTGWPPSPTWRRWVLVCLAAGVLGVLAGRLVTGS
jgi:fluoride ion exporter CrcB/FEX